MSLAKWSVSQRSVSVGRSGGKQPQLSSDMSEDDNLEDEKNSLVTEARIIPELRKRKRLSLTRLKEVKASLLVKQEQSTCLSHSYRKCKQKKNGNTVDRWSEERYRLAEVSMLDVMKAEGATFANPISRPVLRMAARKRIGDTGLLDHLLKHIAGQIAPGGYERFRRWFNSDGMMEYWLEDADLENIRKEAGVRDPFWIPQSRLILGGGQVEDSVSTGELKLLKAEMTKMKRDMEELASKIRNQEELNSTEVIHKEFIKKEVKTEERLNEMAGCLKGLQGVVSGELMAWKTKVEKQLMETTNSLGCMNQSKQHLSSPASERWEDWLESTSLGKIHDDELASWFDDHNIVNIEQDVVAKDYYPALPFELKYDNNLTQDHTRAGEQEMLKEVSIMRNVKEPGGQKQEDDCANVTPDSSATGNSKSELDTSVHMFQEMFQELFNWRAKMEQQVMELSDTVRDLQASHR